MLWDDIRDRLTRELDLQIKAWRRRTLNILLTVAFQEFVAKMESGEKVTLEENYNAFVKGALDEAIGQPIIHPS